jgi:esterase/lipase superfamily enzyme
MRKLTISIIGLTTILCSSFLGSARVAAENASENKATIQTNIKAESATTKKYPLFFVTNRLSSENRKGELKFRGKRSDELVYGEYLRNNADDDIKQATLLKFENEQQFLDAVKATGRSAAVFVHGYRKSFDGSMDFGLSMAKCLDAPLVVFAWPSKNNYCAYMTDECTAEWSAHPLAKVLGDMGETIGYGNIAIVSHSLGARMVQWSLKDLYAERHPEQPFAAALFFSPDVDRDTFMQDAKFLNKACSTCRVYLDKHDTRIWISKVLHGSPRIGSDSKDSTQTELSQVFQFDTSLPSHHIPFALVAQSVHRIAAGQITNQAQ